MAMAKQGDVSASSATAAKPVHVMDFVKQFDFLSISLGGKIHCSLTNRDLPLRVDAVQQHLNSKKLKKEREWYKADYSKYEPLVVAHKTNPKMLYCTLTGIELNRIPAQVEAHVKGKRFLNRKSEVEGLKQLQRQPAPASGDDDEFWAPPGGAGAKKTANDEDVSMTDEDDSDSDGGEEEEKEEEEEEEDAGKRPTRGKAINSVRADTPKGKKSKAKGKGANAKAKSEARASGDKGNTEGAGNKRTGKGSQRKTGKGGKTGPLSDDTPAVSNTPKGAPLASPGAKKTRDVKSKSPKHKEAGKGGGTPEGKRAEVATPAPAAKRKHQVSQESSSTGKKKRKA